MQSSRIIKRRIKTTKNIRQITKAMEMVAASKMRRSQQQATSSKPYSNKLQESLQRLALIVEDAVTHPLLKTNKKGKHVAILIGPDKGLTGGMISNLLKEADIFADKFNGNEPFEFITVGKKAKEYAIKMGFDIMAEFSDISDRLSFEDTLPISKLILDGYTKKEFKDVNIIYMDFVSTLVQKANINQILPIAVEPILAPQKPEELIEEDVSSRYDYIFEPNAEEVLNELLPYYVEILIYQTILEAKASEHSARMVAMKNASDNAKEIIDDLTLVFNKSRQASITNELLDITTATYTN